MVTICSLWALHTPSMNCQFTMKLMIAWETRAASDEHPCQIWMPGLWHSLMVLLWKVNRPHYTCLVPTPHGRWKQMIYDCFQVFIYSVLKCHLDYAWWCLHLIPEPGRQGQEDIYEFKTRLFYIISSRPNHLSNKQINHLWPVRWDGQWACQPELYPGTHMLEGEKWHLYLSSNLHIDTVWSTPTPPHTHKIYLFMFYLMRICLSRDSSTEMCTPHISGPSVKKVPIYPAEN